MIARSGTRFLSFWQLQIIGWCCFYLLVLAVSLPYLKDGHTFRDDNWFVASLFITSCLLRIVCRRLLRRSPSWITLEIYLFAWCAVLGSTTALILEVPFSDSVSLDWAGWLVNSLQYLVVLMLWCNLYFSIKQWQQSTDQKERLLRAENEARTARLEALRYQLNPHFLFNSLNAVSTLVLDGESSAATRMLSQIGDFLRSTLDKEVLPEVTLSKEIALANQYLAIEQTRLGDRLRVSVDAAPETLQLLVPNMLLQPLVENAVRHGIAPLIDGGTISISSKLNDGRLLIVVRNSELNADGGDGRNEKASNGIGLSNIAERLKVLYGDDQRFALDWPQPGLCEARVELPIKKLAG